MTDVAQVERWRPVVGHPGYEVSSQGRVRSLDRELTHYEARRGWVTRRHRGRMLRPGKMKSGHLIVILGRGNNALVHALVLRAFVGPPPPGTECCHRDSNPENNCDWNLRWDTRQANVDDMLRQGRHWQQVRTKRRLEGAQA